MTEDESGEPIVRDAASGAALRPTLDRRRHAYRDDLAAISLKGRVDATHFSAGVPKQVIRSTVPLRARPELKAGLDSEVLFGETVVQYDEDKGWSWVQLERDGYVGYLPANALSISPREATHRVKSLGTYLYPTADIKSAPIMHLSINSMLTIADTQEKFARTAAGQFVIARHIAPKDKYVRDFVDVAERLVGTPYLWGGRSRMGIDCSGLVQVCLEAAGISAPRDSDMQAAELGDNVLVPKELDSLRRGDLVFWSGHVGIMTDGVMMVHANAHHMAVVLETLPEAAERIRRGGSDIIAIRRLEALSA